MPATVTEAFLAMSSLVDATINRHSPVYCQVNGATTLSITTLTIMTIRMKDLYVTFSISDSQHTWHSAKQCSAIMLSVVC